jgi:hypothetical protein
MSTIENKQIPSANIEPSIGDDLLTVMATEDEETRQQDMQSKAFQQFQAGEISRREYNELTQHGAYTEHEALLRQETKGAALDRINGKKKLGDYVTGLFRRK